MKNYLVTLISHDLNRYEINVEADSQTEAQELALLFIQEQGLQQYGYVTESCKEDVEIIEDELDVKTSNGDCIVPIKKLKSSEYLYDVIGAEFKGMLYEDVLDAKIRLTKILIDTLLQEHYMTRDTQRINDVLNAQKFNEKLIKELKE